VFLFFSWNLLFYPSVDGFQFSPQQTNVPLTQGNQNRNSNLGRDTSVYETIRTARVFNPQNEKECNALDGLNQANLSNIFEDNKTKTLVVVMPQLGDFDSGEYVELLCYVLDDLKNANINLRIIGIGDSQSARTFSNFANIPLDVLRVDPEGKLHRQLNLHGGPDWDIPSFVPQGLLRWFAKYVGATDDINPSGVARSWLNYMAMCAGIAAPKTLPEILRGYVGDKSAPERIKPNEVVRVGDVIAIKRVTDVKLGPISYKSSWKEEKGYQRPAELATVRLRVMVEVLSNFKEYVPDQKHLHLRGATFLFDSNGKLVYEHRDTGVLSYSATMQRPLSFLKPFIGEKAMNPLGLGDLAGSSYLQ